MPKCQSMPHYRRCDNAAEYIICLGDMECELVCGSCLRREVIENISLEPDMLITKVQEWQKPEVLIL